MKDQQALESMDVMQGQGTVLTVTDTTSDTTSVSVPTQATHAFLQVQASTVYMTQDGRTPAATIPPVGKQYRGSPTTDLVFPIQDFKNLKLVTASGETAYIDVEFAHAAYLT